MKAGLSLTELATEVDRQQNSKRDFIADSTLVTMSESNIEINFGEDNATEVFGITPTAHGQFADRLGIPKKYYDRMLTTAPELLADNVNHWLHSEPEKRLIRTLDGDVRALLSDRYRRLDNYDLLEIALPAIQDASNDAGGELEIISSNITPRKMYLKFVFPRLQRELPKVGDVVQSGLVLSNSEIGQGSIRIEPLIYTLSCLNGMISRDYSLKKYHVGREIEDQSATFELFQDDTLKAEDELIWRKVRDIILATVKEVTFNKIVDKMIEATDRKLLDPVNAVELTADMFTLREGEKESVLKHLIEGKDLTQYGLLNAVTRASQDVDDYDRATELEMIGGTILTLPKNDLQRLVA